MKNIEPNQNLQTNSVTPTVPVNTPIEDTKIPMVPVSPLDQAHNPTLKKINMKVIVLIIIIIIISIVFFIDSKSKRFRKEILYGEPTTNSLSTEQITSQDSMDVLNNLIATASIGSTLDISDIPSNYIRYISQDKIFQFAFPTTWQKKDNPGNNFEFILADIQNGVALSTIHGYKYDTTTNTQLLNEKGQLAENPTLKFGTVVNSNIETQNVTTTILPFTFTESGQEKYGAVIMKDSPEGNFGITYMAYINEFTINFPTILLSFKLN